MSDTRSYMIVIKDLESDQEVILTVVDWSEAEKKEAVRQVLRWRGVPDHVNFPDDCEEPG